jgi:Uma2 family endonuclease
MGQIQSVLEHPMWLEEVSARWQQVLADESLKGLPFKIETNRGGQIIMSPAKNIHGRYQAALSKMLEVQLGGKSLTECSIATPQGVKVADVAWAPNEYFEEYGYADPYSVAPHICVEIKSPSNARVELLGKVQLYLDAGAQEVWLVAEDGSVRIHNASGPVAKSSFMGELPLLK